MTLLLASLSALACSSESSSGGPPGDGGVEPAGDGGVDASSDATSSDGGDDSGVPPVPADGVSVFGGAGGQDNLRALVRLSDDALILVGDQSETVASSPRKVFPFVASVVGGVLDPSFGSGGKSLIPVEGPARAAVVQPDGKLVIVGLVNDDAGTSRSGFVARLGSKGSLDKTFGGTGIVSLTNVMAAVVALQSDGGVIVGGGAPSFAPGGRLVRLAANGTIDTAFGTSGVLEVAAAVRAVAITTDDKIVWGGGSTLGRASKTGAPDTTFDSDGSVSTGFVTGSTGGVFTIFPLADKKLLIAGGSNNKVVMQRYTEAGALDSAFASGTGTLTTELLAQFYGGVLRRPDGTLLGVAGSWIKHYSADGVLDTTYGTSGTVTHGAFNPSTAVELSTGQLVIGGPFYNSVDYVSDTGLLRFAANGAQDLAFGKAYSQPGLLAINTGSAPEAATGLVELPDGRVLGAIDHYWRGTVTALGRDLAIDTTFGKNGYYQTRAYSDSINGARAIARQPSGKIVFLAVKGLNKGVLARVDDKGVADTAFGFVETTSPRDADMGIDATGAIYVAFSQGAAKVARYSVDGVADAAYAGTGTASIAQTGYISKRAFLVQPDGKALVAIRAATPVVARLAANGDPDAAFGASGIVSVAGSAIPAGLALQSDGKILVLATDATGTTLTIERRLAADGALDTTFGTAGIVTEAISPTWSIDTQPPRIAVLTDGKIAIALGEGSTFTAFRYLPSGARDTSFGTGGKKSIGEAANGYFLRVLAPSAAGAMLLGGGAFTQKGGIDVAVLRVP